MVAELRAYGLKFGFGVLLFRRFFRGLAVSAKAMVRRRGEILCRSGR